MVWVNIDLENYKLYTTELVIKYNLQHEITHGYSTKWL